MEYLVSQARQHQHQRQHQSQQLQNRLQEFKNQLKSKSKLAQRCVALAAVAVNFYRMLAYLARWVWKLWVGDRILDKMQKKVQKVMREYKAGKLHSGKGGPVVKSREQAVAIAMSEAGMAKKK